MKDWEILRWRVATGRTTAVIGALPHSADPDEAVEYVAVRCHAGEPLGPVLEAVRRIAEYVPEQAPESSERAPHHGRLGRDGGVLDDPAIELLLRALARLRGRTRHARALVFRGVESADPASLELLERFVARAEPMPVGLILQFGSETPAGEAGELLAAVRRAEGAHGVLAGESERSETQTSSGSIGAAGRDIAR